MEDGGEWDDNWEEKQQGGKAQIMDNRLPETGSDRKTDNCGDK